MGTRDARVDAYIAKSADFAKPVLNHLRELVHRGCPEVRETLKWSMPFFDYRGPLCHFAAFKRHCAFGFWKGAQIVDEAGRSLDQAMGQFGRLTSLADLPPDTVIAGYIDKAKQRNEIAAVSPPPSKPRPKSKAVTVPDDLAAALKKSKKAAATFAGFSPSHQREYVEWLTEAKREATRSQRLQTAIEWMAEGKPRHWKYAKT